MIIFRRFGVHVGRYLLLWRDSLTLSISTGDLVVLVEEDEECPEYHEPEQEIPGGVCKQHTRCHNNIKHISHTG
jgi:hypothetical protein